MNRQDVLNIINEVVDSTSPLTEEMVIASCEEIDSLSLLSIFLELKKIGIDCSITDFIKCITVGDMVSLVINKSC